MVRVGVVYEGRHLLPQGQSLRPILFHKHSPLFLVISEIGKVRPQVQQQPVKLVSVH